MLWQGTTLLLTVIGLALGDQTSLHTHRYRFDLVDYSTVRGARERVTPMYPPGTTIRAPFIYRNTTWSKPLNDMQKDAIKKVAPFTWRDSADSSNVYIDMPLPSYTRGYLVFSTNWHIISGYLYGRYGTDSSREFITAIVPTSLNNGHLWGLFECVYADVD